MLTERFVTVLADVPESKRIHFNLRYQVFCEETGFEDTHRFPDELERDAYDAAASHFLVWDRLNKGWAAAMRLVDATLTRIPSEEFCPFPLEGIEQNRPLIVEFSRLCILSEYRHTPAAVHFGLLQSNRNGEKSLTPAFLKQRNHEILLRLLYATFGWCLDNNRQYCYGIITSALARILKRFGIPLHRVGQEIVHRGRRIPHRYDVQEAMEGMLATLPAFCEVVESGSSYVPYSLFQSEIPENADRLPDMPPPRHQERQPSLTA